MSARYSESISGPNWIQISWGFWSLSYFSDNLLGWQRVVVRGVIRSSYGIINTSSCQVILRLIIILIFLALTAIESEAFFYLKHIMWVTWKQVYKSKLTGRD